MIKALMVLLLSTLAIISKTVIHTVTTKKFKHTGTYSEKDMSPYVLSVILHPNQNIYADQPHEFSFKYLAEFRH